ncbi:MAG: hypothetical protein WEA77_01585 [Hyphomonas sp.]|uniref:hypothetical protein n=1 Tax=Hyphomonas sp. TaxID=87 RepID=UPI0034A076E8
MTRHAVVGEGRVGAELAGIGAQCGQAVCEIVGEQVVLSPRPGGAEAGKGCARARMRRMRGMREGLGIGHVRVPKINQAVARQPLTEGWERAELVPPGRGWMCCG